MIAISIVLMIIHLLLGKEPHPSNLDEPKIKFDKDSLKKYFFFPTRVHGTST